MVGPRELIKAIRTGPGKWFSSWRSEDRAIPVATPTSPEVADFLAPYWSSPLDVEADAYGDSDEVFGPTEFIAEDDEP